MEENMKICGYCEYGHRLFISDYSGYVARLPIPYVFTKYKFGEVEYWW